MISIRLIPAMLVVASAAQAQTSVVIDEASFTFTRGGVAYGNESFKIIRRTGPDGIEYVAKGTRTIEGRIVKTALTADSSGSAMSYSRATTGGSAAQLTARRALNRLTITEQGGQSSTRDYVFAPGTVILDDDAIHQLYFVTWRDPRAVGYMTPARRTSTQGVLTEVARENLTVGSGTIPAAKFVFGTGDATREIWVDSERRLLRVSYPAQRITGTRDLPPR
ncbi:MAG: hypothetical protein ABIR92_05525 [Gemmatimonadaceae bacterium]